MERVKSGKGELPVNYGMNAMAMFSEERNIGINDVFSLDYDKLNFMDLMALLYVGLKDGARKAGEECKFKTLEEFLDYADEDNEIIGLVAGVFANQKKESKGGEAKKITFDDIQALAFGQMGMRYEDFWYNYTLREFWNAVEGFFEGEERRMRDGWERSRIIYSGIANQYARSPKLASKLLPLPWDNESTDPNVTGDTLEELRREMEEENKRIRDGNKDSS